MPEMNENMFLNKWKGASLPESVYLANPEEAKALMEKHLHHKIAYFGHTVHVENDGHLEILCNGKNTSVSKIFEEFNWNGENFVSKRDLKNWEYTSQGLCEWNGPNESSIKVYAKLSSAEVAKIQSVAKNLPAPLSHDTSPQNYVLQILSSEEKPKKRMFPGLSNLDRIFQTQHPWIRLITPEGDLYSVGFRWKKPIGGTNLAETIPADIRSPDLWESYPVDARTVTSIAIDKEQFEEIKSELETSCQEGIVFNFLTQNCSKYVEHILKKVGFDVDFKVTVGALFWKCLPTAMQNACETILKPFQRCAQAVGNVFEKTLPSFVIHGWQRVLHTVSNAFNRFTTLLNNGLLVCFGATKGVGFKEVRLGFISRVSNKPKPVFENKACAMIGSLKSFFTKDHDRIYLPHKVREWQIKQVTCARLQGRGFNRFLLSV